MKNYILHILKDVFWLIFCAIEITFGVKIMVEMGQITWHLIFVIAFSVLFGMWFVLLIKDVFYEED